MGVSVKTDAGKRLVPTAKEVSTELNKRLRDYMPVSGGVFSGEIQIPSRTGNFALADLRGTFPATEGQGKRRCQLYATASTE